VPASLRSYSGFAVFCFLLGTALLASADSVTVTGHAYAGNDADGIFVNAGSFTGYSVAPGGVINVGFGMVGVPLTLSWSSQTALPGDGSTLINVGNQVTDIVFGSVISTGTFTVPASALAAGTFTAPVDVSGQLQAFRDLTLGTGNVTMGPLMATLLFSGTGTATFQLSGGGDSYAIGFTDVTFTDKGTMTVVPEPTSLFLVGTGLASLAMTVRRKRFIFRKMSGNR